MNKHRVATSLTALAAGMALAVLPLLPASAETVGTCGPDAITVEVKGQRTECVTQDVATGLEALEAAGFDFVAEGGFLTQLEGIPAEPTDDAYWGYSINGEYAQVGAGEADPALGGTETWEWTLIEPVEEAEAETAAAPTEEDITEAEANTAEQSVVWTYTIVIVSAILVLLLILFIWARISRSREKGNAKQMY